MLWRVTLEGRRFLAKLEAQYHSRFDFAAKVDIGKNQVKPLLEVPDHSISDRTIAKIRAVAPSFADGLHYVSQANADRCEIRLARDHSPAKTISLHGQRSLITLYEALLQNPDFASVTPYFDTADEFRRWFQEWGSVSDDNFAEQYFVYRLYGETVIAFLYGERYLRSRHQPLELFAIWYLVGTANAFYETSPVDLDDAAAHELPVGEREAATSLMIRLVEELRADNAIDYLLFDIVASELAQPESYGRLLLRLYARAEAEVREHFAGDTFWRQCQFFVLDFPYMLARWDAQTGALKLQEHRLICCPTRPAIRKWFQTGLLPVSVWKPFLTAVYQAQWDAYDADAPARVAIGDFAAEAIAKVEDLCGGSNGQLACFSLGAYVSRYRTSRHS